MANEEEMNSENTQSQEMHKATCASCNNECEVPFEPKEDRPVYCKDCFQKRRNNNSRFDRQSAPRRMHKATCASCNNECEVPFEPKEDRPVYCRDCFMKNKESKE